MIRIKNLSPGPFSGWKRVTVDTEPPCAAGLVGPAEFVLGRKIGKSTWAVDVKLNGLPSGHEIHIDLTTASATAYVLPPLPENLDAFFGGLPKVNGKLFQLETAAADGSGYSFRMHARISSMLHVRLWGIWRPGTPGLMECEIAVTASNSSIADLLAVVPPEGIHISWGTGLVHLNGLGVNQSLIAPLEILGDGQSRLLPLQIIWPDKITDWASAIASLTHTIVGVGLERLLPTGKNPIYAPQFSAPHWVRERFSESLRRLHTFEPPMCGPNIRSADTGSQEDQMFVRGEALLDEGWGAEMVAYYSALKLGARPCHHLENDGRSSDPTDHPNCMFWWGRPHFAAPDRLGKAEPCPPELWKGWDGPDREHWLYNTLYAAARLTGSPALQWLLEQQARIFLFQETTQSQKPGWGTNGADAARSVGLASLLAVQLDEVLEDRPLAGRVAARWLQRFHEVYKVQLAGKPFGVWDPRNNDPRLGTGEWWMPWQQALGAYGLLKASERFGVPEGIAMARDAAKAVVQDTIYLGAGGRWTCTAAQRIDSSQVAADPIFWLFGTPMAVDTVLLTEPGNLRARSIRAQMVQDAFALGQTSWLSPEVVV